MVSASACRMMTVVSHTASTAEEYMPYHGMMWGIGMVRVGLLFYLFSSNVDLLAARRLGLG